MMKKETVKTTIYKVQICNLSLSDEFILSDRIYDAKLKDYLGSVNLDTEESIEAFRKNGYTEDEICQINDLMWESYHYIYSPHYGRLKEYLPITLPKPIEIEIEVFVND